MPKVRAVLRSIATLDLEDAKTKWKKKCALSTLIYGGQIFPKRTVATQQWNLYSALFFMVFEFDFYFLRSVIATAEDVYTVGDGHRTQLRPIEWKMEKSPGVSSESLHTNRSTLLAPLRNRCRRRRSDNDPVWASVKLLLKRPLQMTHIIRIRWLPRFRFHRHASPHFDMSQLASTITIIITWCSSIN